MVDIVEGLRLTAWAIIGYVILFFSYILIFIGIVIPLLIILVPIVLLFFLLWAGGDKLIVTTQESLEVAQEIGDLFTTGANGLMELMPTIATMWNLIMELLFLLLEGAIDLLCGLDNNPLTTGWIGFDLLECTLLWDLMDIAVDIAMMLFDLIQFVIDVTELFAKIMKPIICLTRYEKDRPFPVYDGHEAICYRMCKDLNKTSDCYSFSTALSWTIQNMPEFIVNVIDLGVPLIYHGLDIVSEEAGVVEAAWPNTKYLWQYLELVIESDGRVVWKTISGLFINYVMTLPDMIYCRLFSKFFTKCMLAFLCDAIIGKITTVSFKVFGKRFTFKFGKLIGFPEICGKDSCKCAKCNWPYKYILGLGNPNNIFFKCPCSTHNCDCDHKGTFLKEVVSDWHAIEVEVP